MNLEYKKDILFRELKQEILSGVFPPGYRFPPELQFARQRGSAFRPCAPLWGCFAQAD